ncbi:contractile injection system protein, VgrG/Pvc8 family [Xanthomonas translucens]|uniref:contractile injection system protein, VgrG/Pvc8 family n=1 Tax=Xanthomonas campestris pv. translucens TaxID=343 RepID=UPI001E620922|nr:contractile injection system protein, VgrG/Pvc8 family [Xanthomonas translucens]
MPRRGVTLTVAIGWKDSGLVEKGTFEVDEVEYSGSPDVITIRARSANLTQSLRNRRERSWHATTLGAVIRGIAGEHGLTARVASSLAGIALPHLDQANESDANLLTRLSKRFDATATVKNGTLIFSPIGTGKTASGKELPTLTLTRRDGDQHRYSVADRDAYSGVRAYWNDKKGARRKSMLVGKDDNAKALRETYDSEKSAREHANAEFKRVQRGEAKFDYTLALGRADLSPEMIVQVQGFKPEIDGKRWLVSKTTHTVTGSGGFGTVLELESALT